MKLPAPALDEWIILLERHIDWRPLMKPGDVYKLLYQGVLGPEHLVDSPSAFTERLKAEYEPLTPGPDDPLLESIHPHESLVRLNLRPFKAAGHDPGLLIEACLQTSGQGWGAPEELRSLWEYFARSYRQSPLAAFAPDEVDEFTGWLTHHDYPAVHHSQAYRYAYQPAYRLVAADLAMKFRNLKF